MNTPFPPVYLAGPTGSGKTAIALELARIIGQVEIINADAFQVYRGMEVISAAPTAAEREAVPHHLFGVLEPSEPCDAAAFAEKARATIAEVGERAIPLVVGGSGLYLKAITHGLAPTPKSDPLLRAELDKKSLDDLVSHYRHLDPSGAEVTNLKNRRYVTRNLEICLLTGQAASTLKSEWQNNQPDLTAFYLKRSREDIYERINQRTPMMFAAGVISEVRALRGLSPTAEKAIGVREIRELLANKIDEASCIEAIQQATRRYAKRQESWFKREPAFLPVEMKETSSASSVANRILAQIPPFSLEP
ncbi:MAG: tRNA (adenosine(37)-N6)-dimethylallyltransferase MiaA [Verrucomicrobiales bacterium]|nr:tRNA (adenosine(37)-N6)-dimethylallyltransferase MiaA [Verrucomicrobiales bacterium]